jgi:hypothetical protein
MTTKKQKLAWRNKFAKWKIQNTESLFDDNFISMVSRNIVNQASADLNIPLNELEELIKEHPYWRIVSDSEYKNAEEVRDFRKNYEKSIADRGPIDETVFVKWTLAAFGVIIVIAIIWAVVKASSIGAPQSSPGDRACEQLGGRASGDRCVFR